MKSYLRGEGPVSAVVASEKEGIRILSNSDHRLLRQENYLADGQVRQADALDLGRLRSDV